MTMGPISSGLQPSKPLQVMPIREGAQIQEPWDILRNSQDEHSWRVLEDEFGCNPEQFQERHYSEFVTFLPSGVTSRLTGDRARCCE